MVARHSCSVPYCNRLVRGNSWSHMCEMHRQRARRFGDPRQPSVRRAELRPYIKRVQQIFKKSDSEKVETGLRSIHGLLSDYCPEDLSNRFHAQASMEIARVLKQVSAKKCGITIGGMFLLRAESPSTFVSDRGFDFALVRAFRTMAGLSCGSTWDYRENRSRKWYRDLPMRTVERMALLLRECYAPFVARLLTRHKAHREAMVSLRNTLNEGFNPKELTVDDRTG